MGCCSSKPDTQSEGPINEPRPQLSEPQYENVHGGNHSPPTPAPNEPGPHEIGVAVTTPNDTIAQQPNGNYQTGASQAPQAPGRFPQSTQEDEGGHANVRPPSASSSSSISSSNREVVRSEEGNRG